MIQDIIKKKRKELNLTQEQVAGILGVSTPAVNKWESGATYPDITLLPSLARLLKTDLNTLLCFKENLTDQEIQQMTNEIYQTILKQNFPSGMELAKHQLAEYPNCGKLLHDIVLILDGALIMSGLNASEKSEYEEQILALYERALSSEDEALRTSARFMLASKYIGKKEFDKAQSMIDLLPDPSSMDKQLLQAHLFQEKEQPLDAAVIYEKKLLLHANESWNYLLSMLGIAIKREDYETAEKLSDTCSKLAALLGMSEYCQVVPAMQIAVAKKQVEKSIKLMNDMLTAAAKPWNMYDCFLYQDLPVKSSEEQSVSIVPALKAELQCDTSFDFLRDNEEFKKLIQ